MNPSNTQTLKEAPHRDNERPVEISGHAFWMLGIVQEEDGSLTGPAQWQSSYLGDCECPGTCLRDHEND